MAPEQAGKPGTPDARTLAEQIRAEFALLEQWQEDLREGCAAPEPKARKAHA